MTEASSDLKAAWTRWGRSVSPSCQSSCLQLWFTGGFKQVEGPWANPGAGSTFRMCDGCVRSAATSRQQLHHCGKAGRCHDQSKQAFTRVWSIWMHSSCTKLIMNTSYCLVERGLADSLSPSWTGPLQRKRAIHRTEISSFMRVFCMKMLWPFGSRYANIYIPDGNRFARWGRSRMNSLLCHWIIETCHERNTFWSFSDLFQIFSTLSWGKM